MTRARQPSVESDVVDGGTQRLPRTFGCRHAMRLVEVGCGIDAMRALAAGFAQALVPGGHALERALQIAQQSADLPQTRKEN